MEEKEKQNVEYSHLVKKGSDTLHNFVISMTRRIRFVRLNDIQSCLHQSKLLSSCGGGGTIFNERREDREKVIIGRLGKRHGGRKLELELELKRIARTKNRTKQNRRR